MQIPHFVRPVGEPIKTNTPKDGGNSSLGSYSGYQHEFYGSGTMALQAALNVFQSYSKTQQPAKCMLGGYGCPDLITACVGANIEPVLLDTAPNSPFPDERSIEKAASEGCSGIILVNFLGISPSQTLVSKCKQLGLFIIEDRAQAFVSPLLVSSLHSDKALFGDGVIFSFGKGKPLSLLGGGMLLVKDQFPFQAVSDQADNSTFSIVKTRLSIIAYNLMIRPFFYPFLLKIPGLSVGGTRYHKPQTVKAMDEERISTLPKAITHFDAQPINAAQNIIMQLNPTFKLLGISLLLSKNDSYRMLRLPLLAQNKEMRDALVELLVEHGIGATKLYQTCIPDVKDIPAQVEAQISSGKQLTNACNFADRLFTIPCHSDVTPADIETIKNTMEAYILPKETA